MEEVNNFKFVVPQIHITLIIDDEEEEISDENDENTEF